MIWHRPRASPIESWSSRQAGWKRSDLQRRSFMLQEIFTNQLALGGAQAAAVTLLVSCW